MEIYFLFLCYLRTINSILWKLVSCTRYIIFGQSKQVNNWHRLVQPELYVNYCQNDPNIMQQMSNISKHCKRYHYQFFNWQKIQFFFTFNAAIQMSINLEGKKWLKKHTLRYCTKLQQNWPSKVLFSYSLILQHNRSDSHAIGKSLHLLQKEWKKKRNHKGP